MADRGDRPKNDDGEGPKPSDVIAALNHASRRKIMRRLAEGPDARSPNELAAEMGVPLSSVAYHMRVLAKKGIVGLVDERPARGAKEHFYVSLVNGDKQVGSFLRATESHDEGVEGQP